MSLFKGCRVSPSIHHRLRKDQTSSRHLGDRLVKKTIFIKGIHIERQNGFQNRFWFSGILYSL